MRRLRHLALAFRWPVIGLLAAGTTLLGMIGFLRHATQIGVERSALDAAYQTIQLFVLEWSGTTSPIPTTLQFARFAAPLVAGLAAARAIVVIFRVELERLWIRLFRRGHVVVCGQGATGWRLAAAVRNAGWYVAGIDVIAPDRPVTKWGLIVGDATDPDTLRRAAVHRARHLVTLCGDEATNIAVARTARRVGSEPLHIHVLTSRPELAAMLRSETYRLHADPAPSLDFFALEERGASLLLDHLDNPPEHVVTVGSSLLTERTIVEAQRRWPRVTVDRVPPNVAAPIEALLGARSIVLVADSPDDDGLTRALRLVQQLKEMAFGVHGGTVDVFALSPHAQNLGDMVAPTHGPRSAIRLHAFDLQEATLNAELLVGGSSEAIARGVHEAYRLDPRNGAQPSPRWEELDDAERESSRAAADAVGRLFQAIGCDLVAATPGGKEPLVLLPSEVELMALLEHDRWLAWVEKHNGAKAHPMQRGWFELDADARHRIKKVIRLLPKALHDVGQRVVRLDSTPARDLHEMYFARGTARGETVETNPSLVPWDRLSQSLQNSNHDQVAHLRVKLRRLGLDLVDGEASSAPLSEAQVEQLAEMEHERWVRHREFDGWVLGDIKDSEAKISPHLVAWSELAEETRETDREFARSIPQLAAALGQHIAPVER